MFGRFAVSRKWSLVLGMIAVTLGSPHPQASAQSACGDRIVISPGDTFAGIARHCGVGVSALLDANPQIANPNALRAGTVLRIPHGGPVREERRDRSTARYIVQPGDTIASIARDVGLPVAAILSLNPEIDPRLLRAGTSLRIPGGRVAARASIEVTPSAGSPGSTVTISASGLPHGARVRLLAGLAPRDLRPLDRLRTDRRGRLRIRVEVPDWAAQAGKLFFAVETTDRSIRVVSQPFRVVVERPRRPRVLAVTGTLTRQGVECQTLRGDDGQLYSLVGDLQDFEPGDRVYVEGRRADMSICMQGTTIEVQHIEEAD